MGNSRSKQEKHRYVKVKASYSHDPSKTILKFKFDKNKTGDELFTKIREFCGLRSPE